MGETPDTNPSIDEPLPEETLAPRQPKLHRPPFVMIAGFLILTIATWLPLVLFARARTQTTDEPRVSIMQDMGTQPKYREQQSSDVFADGRADRPPIEGTVARGQLHDDDFLDRGFTHPTGADVKFFDGFPPQIRVTEQLLARGQERFNIYCSICHGHDGYGHGPVNERAVELGSLEPTSTKWTQAASLHQDNVRPRPNGHLYNTINVGIRSMPGYGSQIGAQDRWAIVAYVRALQLSQNAPPNLASRETLDTLSKTQPGSAE